MGSTSQADDDTAPGQVGWQRTGQQKQALQGVGGQIVDIQHQPALESAAAFLVNSQNADGGWGYSLGQASVVEPTATALLALHSEAGSRMACEQAIDWLRAAQNPDGGWGLTADDNESGWHTAWAVLALASGGAAQEAIEPGVAWLLAVSTLDPGNDELREGIQGLLAIDVDLRGWPWRTGEASFVEPTSLTMQALDAASVTGRNQARLEEAAAYLQDRRCPGGGWNVGNPVMLGKALPPRAHPTAWALLALHRIAPGAITAEDTTALRADMEQDGGALALAWGVLTLATLGDEVGFTTSKLARLQRQDGSWKGNPYHTAVAMLAIRGSH